MSIASNPITNADEIHVENEFSIPIEPNEFNRFIILNEEKRNERDQSRDSLWSTPHDVHAHDEFLHGNDDQERTEEVKRHQDNIPNRSCLTRNQKKNRKKRMNRYRFEVIRHIYHRFTISHVKRILINMNIHYVNINMVRHTLFIGLRDQRMRERVDELLHDEMFTKEHFQRLERRSKQRR